MILVYFSGIFTGLKTISLEKFKYSICFFISYRIKKGAFTQTLLEKKALAFSEILYISEKIQKVSYYLPQNKRL